MDTINELDEDSGAQQSVGDIRPSGSGSQSSTGVVGIGTDRDREADDAVGQGKLNASNERIDSKRLQIQHELEIL